MSRNVSNKPGSPRKGGSPLLTGILVGMVVGVGLAAGLAWFILKSPSPFVNKEQPVVAEKPLAEAAKPARPPVAVAKPAELSIASAPAASGVGEAKPRFEFYKVLTDKQDATVPTKAADKPAAPAVKEIHYLQAASFANPEDAEKLKAKLAILGMEVTVLTATIPDKGVWYRVRVGPYKGMEEMNNARSTLKQNGVDATPMRAQ